MDDSKLLQLGLRAARSIVDEKPFVTDLAEGLRGVVGADCVCIDVCRGWPEETPVVTLAGEPGDLTASETDDWMQLSAVDDPYIMNLVATRDPLPYRVSDLTTLSRFRRTSVYREIYAGFEMRYLVAMAPRITDHDMVIVGLTRRLHDFSDVEARALHPLRHLLSAAFDYQQLVSKIRAELRTVPVDVDPRRLTLTQREDQVLALVAAGHTNDQVARRLGVSPRTVRKHLEAVFPKVGVSNRVAAVAWWLRQN
ncbi:helix-turn-helix transcriptional regulator [Actinoplanes sp. NPDC089786]|uniref:response regulator transcription factor n=1 Tax=Actinoplanes sp. NPDC089786 TaxID=3155185 RepID=UPI00341E2754